MAYAKGSRGHPIYTWGAIFYYAETYGFDIIQRLWFIYYDSWNYNEDQYAGYSMNVYGGVIDKFSLIGAPRGSISIITWYRGQISWYDSYWWLIFSVEFDWLEWIKQNVGLSGNCRTDSTIQSNFILGHFCDFTKTNKQNKIRSCSTIYQNCKKTSRFKESAQNCYRPRNLYIF